MAAAFYFPGGGLITAGGGGGIAIDPPGSETPGGIDGSGVGDP